MYKCAALNCTSELGKTEDKTFYKFPLDEPAELETWVNNMKRDDWTPTEESILCSDHFEEDCFDKRYEQGCLNDGAVPTIFDFTPKQENSTTESTSAEGIQFPIPDEGINDYSLYVDLLLDPEAKRLKRQMIHNIREIENTHRHLKAVRLRARAVRKKITHLPLAMVMLAKDILTEEN